MGNRSAGQYGGEYSELEREQGDLGPQSFRGNPSQDPMSKLKGDKRAEALFETLFENERRLSNKFAAFYHSYSHAALLYEVRAALAAVLYGFQSEASPLPRLLVGDFQPYPSADRLMARVRNEWAPTNRDHNEEFRRVGISAMLSLLARGPECCMQVAFYDGYSCKGIAFRRVIEHELQESCGATPQESNGIIDQILELAERFGLDTCMFGGKPSPSGHAGHTLQIFVRRDLVDHLCYPALPYGEIQDERIPFGEFMNGSNGFDWGQARILAHPKYFCDTDAVKMFAISADPLYQDSRETFQENLTGLLRSFIQPKNRRCIPFCGPKHSKLVPSRPVTNYTYLNVTVPENYTAGTKLNVVAPGGQVLSASVPDGLAVGSTFQVSYLPQSSGCQGQETLTVTVPDDVKPDKQMQIKSPDGQELLVSIPKDLKSGDKFQVKYSSSIDV